MRLFFLAWRNVFRQKRRTLATLSAVVLGLAGLVVFDGFLTQLMRSFRDSTILSGIGHVQVAASERYWAEGEFSPYAYGIPDSDRVLAGLKSDSRVAAAFPSTGFTAVAGLGEKSATLLVKAYPADRMYFAPPTGRADASRLDPGRFWLGSLSSGRAVKAGERATLILGKTAARILGARPGDIVTLMALLPDGGLNGQDFTIVGVYDSPGNDKIFAYTDYSTASSFTNLTAPPVFHVLLKNLKDTEAFANDVKSRFGGLAFRTWPDLATYYIRVNTMFQSFLTVIRLILLLVMLFLMGNSLNRVVLERMREWGCLRAMGTTSRDVVLLVVLEGFFQGLVGSVLGISAGFAAALIINLGGGLPFKNAGAILSVLVQPNLATVVIDLVPLVATATLAAVGPAFRAAKKEPAECLREYA